jgi:decaprenyl-phosphate phosphoribosyltransferase
VSSDPETSGIALHPTRLGGRVARSRTLLAGVLTAARPRQWLKNLLLVAAPMATATLHEADVLVHVSAGVAAFCLASSGLYLLNDAHDAAEDRTHPLKVRRPVASGVLSTRAALVSGAGLIGAGLALGVAVRWEFAGVLALYVMLTLAYIVVLRTVAVLDIVTVASGYFLRAAAGAVAIDVPLSRWFAIVAAFGSLFLVAAKRQAEHTARGAAQDVRTTLGVYTAAYLRNVVTITVAVSITGYCLWAFERADAGGPLLFELTIAPFVVFILRYLLLVEHGHGEAPEDVVLGDRMLLASAGVWCALFAAAVYAS